MPVAPRIVNDVSYLTRINEYGNFSWQAQYLVMLDNDFCCFAHCKGRFIIVQSSTGSTELHFVVLA